MAESPGEQLSLLLRENLFALSAFAEMSERQINAAGSRKKKSAVRRIYGAICADKGDKKRS
jgi:hypothetical protein